MIGSINGGASIVNITKTGANAINLGGSTDNAFMNLHVQQGSLVYGQGQLDWRPRASSVTGLIPAPSCSSTARVISRCTREVR